jgi:hypothetical protein
MVEIGRVWQPPTNRRGSYCCTGTHNRDSGVDITTGAATEEEDGPGKRGTEKKIDGIG